MLFLIFLENVSTSLHITSNILTIIHQFIILELGVWMCKIVWEGLTFYTAETDRCST